MWKIAIVLYCPAHLAQHSSYCFYCDRYEMRAIQLDKLRRMASGNEEPSNCTPYEVEMSETNTASHLTSVCPPSP